MLYLLSKQKENVMFKKEETKAHIYLAVSYFIIFTIPGLSQCL